MAGYYDFQKRPDEELQGDDDYSSIYGPQDSPDSMPPPDAGPQPPPTAITEPPDPTGTVEDQPKPPGTTGNVPPPPPPPPPAPPPPNFRAPQVGSPGMGAYQAPATPAMPGHYDDLMGRATEWLDNPNPYDSEFMQAQRAAMDERLNKKWQDGTRGVEEWAASRGLVGSSYEGDQQVQMNEALRRQQAQEEAQLLEQAANATFQNKQAAFNMALQTGNAQEAATQFRASLEQHAAQFGWESAFRVMQSQQQTAMFNAEMALKAAMAGDDSARWRAGLALDSWKAMDASMLSREELAQRNRQIDALFEQIRQGDRRLTDEQARWQAEYEFLRKKWEDDRKRWEDEFEMKYGGRDSGNNAPGWTPPPVRQPSGPGPGGPGGPGQADPYDFTRADYY
jgi:hypothetical protein